VRLKCVAKENKNKENKVVVVIKNATQCCQPVAGLETELFDSESSIFMIWPSCCH